jgi:FAD synthetase
MSLENLTSKYISSAEIVLNNMQKNPTPITVNEKDINNLISYIYDYLEDAKYYKTSGKLETSLTSIAYCEGILDALRLLGAVTFEWPTTTLTEQKPKTNP